MKMKEGNIREDEMRDGNIREASVSSWGLSS